MYDDEIGLESHSKKNLVGGDLDLIVASPTNGKRTVNILGQGMQSCYAFNTFCSLSLILKRKKTKIWPNGTYPLYGSCCRVKTPN